MIDRHLADHAIHRETDGRGFGMMAPHPLAPANGESWLPVAAVADGSAVVFVGEVRPEWGIPDAERRRRIARDAITFPEYHPPVRRILAGRDGSIWLLREAWPRDASFWEVYDEEGNRY